MVSDVIKTQFAHVHQDFPSATLMEQPDGNVHLEVRGVRLPSGWNKETVSILVIVPADFPDSRPDGFYADVDLNLAAGQVGASRTEVAGRPWLKFCWQVQTWDPGRDTLWKYVKAMLLRFLDLS